MELKRNNRVDLALAYVRGVPWVSNVVLGAETVAQVQENVTACEMPALTAEELVKVDQVVEQLGIPPRLLSPGEWNH